MTGTIIVQVHVYNAHHLVSNAPLLTIVWYVNNLTAYILRTPRILNVFHYALILQYPLFYLSLNYYNACLVILDALIVYFLHLFVPNAQLVIYFTTINV